MSFSNDQLQDKIDTLTLEVDALKRSLKHVLVHLVRHLDGCETDWAGNVTSWNDTDMMRLEAEIERL